MGALSILNSVLLAFLLAEFVRVIFFTKDWRYRFNKESVPIESWKKGLIVLVLFVFAFPLINWVFVENVSRVLVLLGSYQISLFVVLVAGVYLWITKRTLSLPWDRKDVVPVLVIVLDLVVTIFV